MNQIEPMYWMGQTLGFVIMSAVMGVWRQAATITGTSLASQKSWRAIILSLTTQAIARFLLGLSSQVDHRILNHFHLDGWVGGPFEILALLLGTLGLLWLFPLWDTVLRKVTFQIKSNTASIVTVGLSIICCILFSNTFTGYLDLCAGMSMTLVGSAMYILAWKKNEFEKIKLAGISFSFVGFVFILASLETIKLSWVSCVAAIIGSLFSLCSLHARVHEVSKGRVGDDWHKVVLIWLLSWFFLVVAGPLLWLATGSGSDGFKNYIFSLGLLSALFVISWHFRKLSMHISKYADDLGRDRSRTLLSALDASAFLIDRHGSIIDCSNLAAKMCFCSWSEIKGRVVWDSLGVYPITKGSFEAKDKHGRDLVLTLVELGAGVEDMSALTVRDITSEKSVKKAMDKAAREDELTGLPNRREALEIVDISIEASRGVEGLGLLFMDLDHFKNVNDTEGHAAGDALLREVSSILNETIKEYGGWLARLGGDEFLGVIAGGKEDDCLEAAYRCVASMERSARAEKGSVGISVGIALFPRDGDSGIDLIRRADAAMYESKSNGRGRVSLFGEAIESRLRRRVQVEGFLRESLKLDQGIAMVLQPLCFMDGTFNGHAEALIRAPGMQGLNAQELITVAEHSGLIMPLGRWVLRQAAIMQRDAEKKGVQLILSINVSAKQFMDEMFWEMFRGMARLGQFPKGITLEVTETTLMDDVDRSIRLLAEARSLGASIALDDFGAGYSSLSTLKRMPLDKLKLDKSLLDEVPEVEEAKRVAQAAIAMADALGLDVVAEGVERQEQAQWLKSKGVKNAQGYLFAKPMSPDNLFALILQSNHTVLLKENKD